MFPADPPLYMIAIEARCSHGFARKCIDEVIEFGDVVDPEEIKSEQKLDTLNYHRLSKEDEMCLLSLHTEELRRFNVKYCSELLLITGNVVCSQTISNFLNRRFDIKRKFV